METNSCRECEFYRIKIEKDKGLVEYCACLSVPALIKSVRKDEDYCFVYKPTWWKKLCDKVDYILHGKDSL